MGRGPRASVQRVDFLATNKKVVSNNFNRLSGIEQVAIAIGLQTNLDVCMLVQNFAQVGHSVVSVSIANDLTEELTFPFE